MTVEFGTTDPRELPAVPMAYVARAIACGHIAAIIADNGTARAAGDATVALWDLYSLPAVLERIPLSEARIESCPQCDVSPPPDLGL